MNADEPTELELELLRKEPVSLQIGPAPNGDPLGVQVNWGVYGYQASNPYHRIMSKMLGLLERGMEITGSSVGEIDADM